MKATYCATCGVLIATQPSETKKEQKFYSLCKSCERVKKGGTAFSMRDLGVA